MKKFVNIILVAAVLALTASCGNNPTGGKQTDAEAEAQAEAAQKIMPLLDDAEAAVYRRGRNSRVHGVPAHANPAEYHSATGLEALFGWLYLQGMTERIGQLFAEITEERTGDGSEC